MRIPAIALVVLAAPATSLAGDGPTLMYRDIETTTEGQARGVYVVLGAAHGLGEAVRVEAPGVRFRKDPVLPFEVRRKHVACSVEFYVDEKGWPYAVDQSRCPEHTWTSGAYALVQWEFEPVLRHGQAVPARFRETVLFYRDGSDHYPFAPVSED